MLFAPPPPDVDISTLTPTEQAHLARAQKFMSHGYSYAQLNATVPSTVGLVLSSSPIALLAWIAEKLIRWSDISPPLTTILDFVTLYYLTDTIPRNLYRYREVSIPGQKRPEFPVLPGGKTLGFSSFEREISVPPRSWAEAWVGGKEKLAFYRYHEKGGHFAALEVPEVLLGDVDDFVGLVEGEEITRGLKSSSL
jgi:microsomal epoxide hydrolase